VWQCSGAGTECCFAALLPPSCNIAASGCRNPSLSSLCLYISFVFPPLQHSRTHALVPTDSSSLIHIQRFSILFIILSNRHFVQLLPEIDLVLNVRDRMIIIECRQLRDTHQLLSCDGHDPACLHRKGERERNVHGQWFFVRLTWTTTQTSDQKSNPKSYSSSFQ